MIKILSVFGTRPEAIKMAPLVQALDNNNEIESKVCVTGQHREMLDEVLNVFKIKPDYDLNIMKHNQTLFDVTTNIMISIKSVLEDYKPSMVLVHGDTSTTFATALACFYLQIPVGHVEAGLRTYNIWSPYPEEFNRQAVTRVASLHFAPTSASANILLSEGIDKSKICITGNTAIDALKTTISQEFNFEHDKWLGNSKLILLTAHRRENIGTPMENLFKAIVDISDKHKDVKILYPIHLNPKVRELADKHLKNNENIKLIDPLDVVSFHNLLDLSYIIVTDSGGIQEEAPSLGKPVLVFRDTTERPEGVEAGTLKLVGTSKEGVYDALDDLLTNSSSYVKMSTTQNPYGDGNASSRIVNAIIDYFEVN